MKNIYKITQKILLVSILLISYIAHAQFTPINVNTTPNTSSCSINGGDFIVSVPSEVLSGNNVMLNITLPPTGCDVDMSIAYSSPNNKIEYVTSTSLIDFSDAANTTSNDNPITVSLGNDGLNFNITYKFPNYTTCNGELGTFVVTFTTCGATCTATVSTTARAENYWTINKSFVRGNMVCGTSDWRFYIEDNNPNPSGYGGYKIQGSVTENPTAPITVVGNSVLTTGSNWTHGEYNLYTSLNNCKNVGDIITNTADYNFTLGGGCETMIGTLSADSTVLEEPAPSLDFRKTVYPNTGISPGCSGKYRINIKNNGNVPLQINSVTDVIPTSDITITSVVSTGFVNNNLITSTNFNFTTSSSSPLIIAPGHSKEINFSFTVNASATIGSTVTNTAQIDYNAIGTSSNNSNNTTTSCPGTNCPPVDEGILNDDASVDFTVIAPQSKEKFYKCITSQPIGNIYNLGEIIHFRYILGSGGSASLTTNITDDLGLPNQNLQVVPGSINYTYYEHESFSNNYSNCNLNFTNPPQPITFGHTDNISNQLQDLSIDITNMPGTCDYGYGNFLVIEFDAEVLLQVYGNKVNTAYTDSNQNSASYTIDQFGVLSVNKRADQEFVENGSSFNYIIEVTNNGSVPLDHINISDNLPSCISLTEGITITDFANNTLNYSLSGSLNIAIDPNTQLMPGQKFIITIPAIKNGGSTCCNESVIANGTMITSGVVLEANFGTVNEPAACVKSTECCDIQDFEANLYENADGSYSVTINGGAVPIQQVDVAVIDYHVTYNQRDCQPQDMGVFGQLSTNRPLLNGLAFEATSNNTSNLTWLPGNPAVMNTSVDFNISKPNVLDLECCDVDFDFCIKVTVKDVNCNVCEKIICPEPFIEEEPCNISVQDVKRKYCTNETITINWTGSDTSGNVDVYLVPDSGSPIQIASNQPETSSLNWTIPSFSSDKQCDRNWKIIVVDLANEGCMDISNTFYIECCEEKCECGDWKTNVVRIERKYVAVHSDYDIEYIEKSQSKNPILKPLEQYEIKCSGSIQLKKGTYQITSPMFGCEGDCHATYKWILKDMQTGQVTSGVANSFNYNFSQSGKYKILFTPICGGSECDPCEILVAIY